MFKGYILHMKYKYLITILILFSTMLICGCNDNSANINNTIAAGSSHKSPISSDSPSPSSQATPKESSNQKNKLLSFSLRPEENPSLKNTLSWTVNEAGAHNEINYLISDEILKNAVAYIETENGSELTKPIDLRENYVLSIKNIDGTLSEYEITTNRLTCNLPVFYIEIENGKEVTSKEEYLKATIKIDTNNAIDSFPSLDTTNIYIKGRGHFSWKFDKTPYKIRFNSKTPVLGLEASKNWVLSPNYPDRTLIQNYVAMEMGRITDNIEYQFTQYPVDVFVNGSYRGVYTFGEQVEVKEERINLIKDTDEIDTDFLIEIGGNENDDIYGEEYFHIGTVWYMYVKHPSLEDITNEQKRYIFDYFYRTDNAIRALDGYENFIDIDSLIDWLILHEITYNLDSCFRRSCFITKKKGDVLKMGPIWDFDLAFGNHFRYEENDWATIGGENEYVRVSWINYLIEDANFRSRLKARWEEIKAPLLSKAMEAIDHAYMLVSPSAEYNFIKWDELIGTSSPCQPSYFSEYTTYELHIQRLKDFINERYTWFNNELSNFN